MHSSIYVLVCCMVCMAFAADSKKPPKEEVSWKSKRTNVTVTAEVLLDVTVRNYDESGDLFGTIKIGLFGDVVPMTVLNFHSICNGAKRPSGELKFTNTYCHRLITDLNFQCGDITTGDGSGGISIFGETFNDENFDISIGEKGTIAMANRGPNTNGSQFFIVFRTWQYLEGNHVAFGQVIGKESLDFLDKINSIKVKKDGYTPTKKIKITDCQAKEVSKKYKIQRKVPAKEDSFEN